MHCNITQATTVKDWVRVLQHTTPLIHINSFKFFARWGVAWCGHLSNPLPLFMLAVSSLPAESFLFYEVYKGRPSVKVWLLACSKQLLNEKSLFWLKTLDTSWATVVTVGGNRDAYILRRDIMWIDAVEKDMLLILHIISITQVTGGGITLTPCRCLKT